MVNLIKNELLILSNRKKYRIFAIILVIITVLTAFFMGTTPYILHSSTNFSFVNYIINISFCSILILCFSIILMSEIFGLEFSKETIDSLFVTPQKKLIILISKLLIVILYIVIQYIGLFILAIILNIFFFQTPINFIEIINIFLARNLLGLLTSIFLSMMIIIFTKSISIATLTPILLYFIGNLVSYYLPHFIKNFYIYTYVGISIKNNNLLWVIFLTIIYLFIFIISSILKFQTNKN